MPSLSEQIEQLRTFFMGELREISSTKDLEQLKVKYLGKKGPIQSLMQDLKNCSSEERPHLGKLINVLKEEFSSHCSNTLSRLQDEEMSAAFEREWLDATLPGRRRFSGKAHPINQTLQRILDILIGMGFAGFILFWQRSFASHAYEQCASPFDGKVFSSYSHCGSGACVPQ